MKRSFLPGSEWLLAKLYSGPATVDAVLRDAVAPLVRAAVSSGAADRWFYLRYGDPDWHLRVRLHGDPARLRSEVEPALAAATAGLLEDGRLWKVELGTYEREVERYGGPEAIELAERLFHADSDACLEIIEKLERGDAGLDERWRLCLCGMDRLLADLGFDLPTRLQVARDARAAYAAESRVDGAAEAKLSARFREERKSLEPLIEPTWDPADPLAPGFEILAARSACLAPVTAELRRLEEEGRLATPLAELAQSFLHMHANRLLRSGLRRQEFVLWDFLLRLYESKVVRSSTRNE